MMRRRSLCAVVVGLLWIAASCAGATEYACLRFLPAAAPTVFFEFQGKQMRLAPSVEGLAAAPWVEAVTTDSTTMEDGQVLDVLSFPEQVLPEGAPGGLKTRLALTLYRAGASADLESLPVPPGCYGVCSVEKKDAKGAVWTFPLYVSAPLTTDPAKLAETQGRVPDIGQLSARIETKVEGKEAHLGVRLFAAEEEGFSVIREVAVNGKPAPVRLEVRDSKGKLIRAKNGDLKTFGFT